MEVDLTTIQRKFDAILAASETRESVSNWARELREADDRQQLKIVPASDKQRLWNAILFLEGVDLKDAPDSYLHNEEDIIREKP